MEFLRKKDNVHALQMLTRAENKLMELSNRIDFYKDKNVLSDKELPEIDEEALFDDAQGGDSAVESLKNKLFGLTYNNFGCVYKQKKDLTAAFSSLKRALYYESLEEAATEKDGKP